MSDRTKERILNAAERLFARHGCDATSLRAITAEAKVNIAAVNYHFRSKEALLQAVYARRIGPINRKRLELLDQLEAKHEGRQLPLEPLVEIFVRPVLEAGAVAPEFTPLMGRMYVEPGDFLERVIGSQMKEMAGRFPAAFQRALPGVPPVELYWRIHFLIGAMAHTLAGSALLKLISGGACDPTDVDAVVKRMVRFFSAGLRAPVSTYV